MTSSKFPKNNSSSIHQVPSTMTSEDHPLLCQAFQMPRSVLVTGDKRMCKMVPICKGLKSLNEEWNKN